MRLDLQVYVPAKVAAESHEDDSGKDLREGEDEYEEQKATPNKEGEYDGEQGLGEASCPAIVLLRR